MFFFSVPCREVLYAIARGPQFGVCLCRLAFRLGAMGWAQTVAAELDSQFLLCIVVSVAVPAAFGRVWCDTAARVDCGYRVGALIDLSLPPLPT